MKEKIIQFSRVVGRNTKPWIISFEIGRGINWIDPTSNLSSVCLTGKSYSLVNYMP